LATCINRVLVSASKKPTISRNVFLHPDKEVMKEKKLVRYDTRKDTGLTGGEKRLTRSP
jgi:hypothetical protein